VVEDKFRWASKDITLDDLIPLETEPQSVPLRTGPQRLVIGHNVAFDRSFVKEQYFVQVMNPFHAFSKKCWSIKLFACLAVILFIMRFCLEHGYKNIRAINLLFQVDLFFIIIGIIPLVYFSF